MRNLVVLTALILVAAPATAQTTLGLKGGIGFATAHIEDSGVEEGSVSGVVAGVDLGVPVSGAFGLRFTGSYAQKGGSGTAEDATVTLNIDYFQLAARARIGTSGDGVSAGLLAGPWAGYRLSCEASGALEGLTISSPCDDPNFADLDIETMDFGVAFGGSFGFPLAGSLRLEFDALYSLGLATIDNGDTKTRHLTIQTGLAFPIG